MSHFTDPGDPTVPTVHCVQPHTQRAFVKLALVLKVGELNHQGPL